MIRVLISLMLLCLCSASSVYAHDMQEFNSENLAANLRWEKSALQSISGMPEILSAFLHRRDNLSSDQILSVGGWKFVGAYFDRPTVIGVRSVQLNILLNQTHLTEQDSIFKIERYSRIYKLNLARAYGLGDRAVLSQCTDSRTYSSILFMRPMTSEQLVRFIPGPMRALFRLAKIGFGNIKSDPFGHLEELLGLFNQVDGVDTRFTEDETKMVKEYSQHYLKFEEAFSNGGRFENPCDNESLQGPQNSTVVQPEQVLIFR